MKNEEITVSAPSKIHLIGEHSVVYGKPALLAAVNKRIRATIKKGKTKNSKIVSLGNSIDLSLFQKAIEDAVKRKYKIKKIPPYEITVSSEIPIGAGLGSSAALSAVAASSLLSFLGLKSDKNDVFETAYEGERHFHGNPSGGDLACVIQGGILYFRKEFEFLKTFSKLPFKIHKNIRKFLLIDSGRPAETTRDLVSLVAVLKKNNPKKIEDIFNSQEELTKKMVLSFKNGDEKDLMFCIKEAERNLERLGVVGEKVKRTIEEIEKLGGVAKISGAGGIKGGAGILLSYNREQKEIKNGKILEIDYEGLKYE